MSGFIKSVFLTWSKWLAPSSTANSNPPTKIKDKMSVNVFRMKFAY